MAVLLRRKRIDLPTELVTDVVQRARAQPWFVYAFETRGSRWHVWKVSFWLATRLKSQARILETGCGCALNLIWFGQHGFSQLYGFDNDPDAIQAGTQLCSAANISATLWIDDGLRPFHLSEQTFDAILAVNWTYGVEAFDLIRFLITYRSHLTNRGFLALDVVDIAYNSMPDNQYLTSDRNKPATERGPSEYKKRYSQEQVFHAASCAEMKVVHTISRRSQVAEIPRCVYILSRQ
ncbi:MAG: class I SAM-dependent methyltransferase [candidate division NC10 bacterium]|nr:class I SAM-dependent methyltransferase [candidate division NC10 bacterium]